MSAPCVHCGGSRNHPPRARGKLAAIPLDLLLANRERDPFCSTECAKAYHGVAYKSPVSARPPVTTRTTCLDCEAPLNPKRPPQSGPRCRDCAIKHRRARNFNIPGCCAGCGCPLDEHTQGCYRCSGRATKRRARANPETREREREHSRRYKRKKSAATAIVAGGSSRTLSSSGSPSTGGTPVNTESGTRKAA